MSQDVARSQKVLESTIRFMKQVKASVSKQQIFQNMPGAKTGQTPAKISVDELSLLGKELKSENLMVFRLGSPPGTNKTEFALAKAINGWTDYFFLDDEIFSEREVKDFDSEKTRTTLNLYHLLPQLTETSMVNLGLGTGLIQSALRIDEPHSSMIPATGSCKASFLFKPHAELPDFLRHNEGQIQIDSLFLGKRAGEDSLFILEAKKSEKLGSLAKHKLYYPLMALPESVPYKIVPVYLRTVRNKDSIDFNIAECEATTMEDRARLALNELKVVRSTRLRLRTEMPNE